MRFIDFPRPLAPGLYEEAARAYAELVASRVHAVYQTGSTFHSGLSDLDLIVVPIGPRYDNYAYFSTSRLPDRLRSVFRHEPFVLPVEMVHIIQYTTHTRPRLVHGRDVLPSGSYEETLEDSWSMLLEDYCRYQRYMSDIVRADHVRTRFLLSKLASIRIPIERLNKIAGSPGSRVLVCQESLQRGEALRSTWFENSSSPEAKASEAWALLRNCFSQLADGLREVLKLPEYQDLRQFAHAFLRGEPLIAGVNPAAVRLRQQTVLHYLRSLCVLKIEHQPLVPNTLFADEISECWRSGWPPRPVRAVVRLRYGLDKTLRYLYAHGR